ncbi:hypothetical protein Tco_0924051 [Tanacetum coccineum]|uniref:Uncharacterized protein n=1 Tax=Tanacetum coccineum TaxID=301880 RepID=A0ABQ5D5G8_9ASTR
MSSDSAVTYTSVHSEARSWSIPSEDPYEEAARQLLEQAPHPSEYVPDPMELEDHVPVYIPEPEHPEDLVPAEDEAPIEPYITEVAFAPTPPLPPPSFLPALIRPPHTRASMAQRRAIAPSIYHSLLPVGTSPLLPIPLPAPSTSRRADIPKAGTPPRKRLLLTSSNCEFWTYCWIGIHIMSSITAQQTKLDLELVSKEKRLEIRKCNGRLNPRKKQREPTFQVVLDALALTPCYSTFLTTADVPEVYMHQF